ncbi:MAG: SIS domain-containing protein [Cyclobacteriaceae bacterium]|nr:SIS domain-containing protein [Cyclobacteriaceae bacterium]
MSVIQEYISLSKKIADTITAQESSIKQAADWFTKSIQSGRMVHVFGSGHSRILVEEMWPRYGSFPGFNPIVELSLTFHNLVVGANGQRQAMFLENVSGLAERILRNFDVSEQDTALIISSSGTNVVPVEMAEEFRKKKIKVVSILTSKHSEKSESKRSDGKKLRDFSDLVLDTGAPAGDSMIYIQGLETPVAPGSTLGGVMLINCLKAEVARLLTEAGHPPIVLTAANVVGKDKATALFERAYDDHAHRLARLYEHVGESKK